MKECRFIRKSYLPCINFFFFLGVHKIESDEKQPTYLKQSEFLLDKTHFMNWFLKKTKICMSWESNCKLRYCWQKKKNLIEELTSRYCISDSKWNWLWSRDSDSWEVYKCWILLPVSYFYLEKFVIIKWISVILWGFYDFECITWLCFSRKTYISFN